LDNYMAEVVHINEFDRGVVEFFRELPGLMLIVILAMLCRFSENEIFRIGSLIMLIGLSLVSYVAPVKVLLVLSMTVYSVGEHMLLGMKSAISLDMASPNCGGRSLGLMGSISNAGNIMGFLAVSIIFFLVGDKIGAFHLTFTLSLLLMAIAVVCSFLMTSKMRSHTPQRRFYFRRKFFKYYMLEVFYGARKQVFLTFGPYVIILFYHASASVIGILYAVCAVCGMFLSPVVGRIIDHFGYRVVMIADTLILVVVCFFYGFSHLFFSSHVAFVIACFSYVLDSVISLASMASSVYVKALADSKEEVTATLSTGISVNHLISIIIALFGGWIWHTAGIEMLFTLSALLGIANSIYAATIPKGAN